jgi:lysozyme
MTEHLSGEALARHVFGARNVVPAGLELIREFEGLRLQAYLCPGGVWTIGYGHTRTARAGMVITAEQADWLLLDDVRQAERVIEKHITVPLNDHQFAVLVSLVFNIGAEKFRQSTLVRLLNRGWYEQVPAQLMRWNKARGETLGGLTRRRRAEAALWNRPVS